MMNGYMGCITVSLSCRAYGSDRIVHNTTFIGIGPWTFEKLEVRDDYEDRFKEAIERKCGRIPESKVG